MSVQVKVGDVYTELKMGVSAKGQWGFATARAEKGYDRITIWFTNPENIPEDTYAVRVAEITEVGTQNKQLKDGRWVTQYYARAKMESVEGGAVAVSLDDEGVPF